VQLENSFPLDETLKYCKAEYAKLKSQRTAMKETIGQLKAIMKTAAAEKEEATTTAPALVISRKVEDLKWSFEAADHSILFSIPWALKDKRQLIMFLGFKMICKRCGQTNNAGETFFGKFPGLCLKCMKQIFMEIKKHERERLVQQLAQLDTIAE
jgi:hypothetical protein